MVQKTLPKVHKTGQQQCPYVLVSAIVYVPSEQIIISNSNDKMFDPEESQIVRYVNTFTVGDWQARRPNERMKKGITRVTKSTSQSADKFAQMLKQRRLEHQMGNDENQNMSNRNKIQTHDPASPTYLLERIKHLQMELTVLEKEKIELQRRVHNENGERRPMENFVQSHYIACKQDVEELMNERGRLQEAINNMQAENNFLKLNIGFQEQYIAKIQGELNNMKMQGQPQAKPVTVQQEIQCDNQEGYTNDTKLEAELVQIEVQCQDYQANEYEELNQLAMRFQQQTTEFEALIQKLERQNCILNSENERLNRELDQIFVRYNENSRAKDNQQQLWNNKIKTLQEDFESKLRQLSEENERKVRENAQYYSQRLNDKSKEIELLTNRTIKTPAINKQQAQLKQDLQQLQRKYQQSIYQLHESKQREIVLTNVLTNAQNQLVAFKNTVKELEISQELLRLQQVKNGHLQQEITNLRNQIQNIASQQNQRSFQQAQYSNLKHEFDSLLIYLQQKNQQLKQKQLRLGQQLQNEHLIYMKNQQTLRRQTEMQAIISHYEHQIKKIQSSLQSYITEILAHKRQEKQGQLKELKARQELQMKSNKQEKLYLLNKIDSLQQQLTIVKNEKTAMSYLMQNAKLEQKQQIISQLRLDLLELSKKYEHEVLIKNQQLEQNYHLSQRLNEEQITKASFKGELQIIKSHYDNQIQAMQANINQLEKALQAMKLQNFHAKQAFQLRLVQVKRDYDVLYNKYLKYKDLSRHLQDTKSKRY